MDLDKILGALLQGGGSAGNSSAYAQDRIGNAMGGDLSDLLNQLGRGGTGGLGDLLGRGQSAPQQGGTSYDTGGTGSLDSLRPDATSSTAGRSSIPAAPRRGPLDDLFGGRAPGNTMPPTGNRPSNPLEDIIRGGGGGRGNSSVLGGLGDLLGTILGGGRSAAPRSTGKSPIGGALKGGLMAILGSIALRALKNKITRRATMGFTDMGMDPENVSDREAELVLRAMINAVKADGVITEDEFNYIMGHLEESGADDETKEYLIEKLKAPMETEALIAEAQGNIELAAKLYSASLIPIEANANERAYLAHLAAGMGLDQQTAASIEEIMGVKA
ncbi:MAG: tellurite resistance TerB family protein [Deltaproteobacteria bacterium]|nr:tellurite resistance TerB family protein [Deltaproteobacteria bacterium]